MKKQFTYKLHTPSKTQKTWLNTHAPLFRVIFRGNPSDWKPKNTGIVDWSDIDRLSRVKNSFNTKLRITSKSFLVTLLRKKSYSAKFFPPSLIVTNLKKIQIEDFMKSFVTVEKEQINEDEDETHSSSEENVDKFPLKLDKFYLKPDNGFAGQGIHVVSTPEMVLDNIKPHTTYILQKSIPNMMLYKDKYKFEFR